MKKFWFCLISFLALFLLSCSGDVEIEWVVMCDISDIDFNRIPIEIVFSNENSGKKETFRLVPNETKKIRLKRNMGISEIGLSGNFSWFIYPRHWEAYDAGKAHSNLLIEYGKIEIYISYMWPVEEYESSVTLIPHERVVLYRYCVRDGEVEYRFYSENNRINTNRDTLFNIDEHYQTYDRIHEILLENNIYECYFSIFDSL